MFEVRDNKEGPEACIEKIKKSSVSTRSISVVFFDVPWMGEVIDQVVRRLGVRIYQKGDEQPYSQKLIIEAIRAHSDLVHYRDWGSAKMPDHQRIARLYEHLHKAATSLVPFVFESGDARWNIGDGAGFEEVFSGIPADRIRVCLDERQIEVVRELDFRTHRLPLVDRYEQWFEVTSRA